MGRQGQGRFYEVAPALFRGTLIGSIRRSGRLTRVEMVEAAHLGKFDYWTITNTFVHRDHIAQRAAQKRRSQLRRVGALAVRFSTSSWCRNARFSMTR